MNALRNTLLMARKDLKVILRDRGQLIVLFALPLLLSVVIGSFWTTMVGASHPGGGAPPDAAAHLGLAVINPVFPFTRWPVCPLAR